MADQKTLIVVRHGKSSWDSQGLSDIDRPLKEKGVRNACEMAEKLKNDGIKPEIIYSSPACRAAHTAIIFMRILNLPEENFFIKNDIYLSDTEDIINVIAKTGNDINSLMIFGHNPGFTDLVNYLSPLKIANISTAGVVILHFATGEWKNIGKSNYISGKYEFPGE